MTFMKTLQELLALAKNAVKSWRDNLVFGSLFPPEDFSDADLERGVWVELSAGRPEVEALRVAMCNLSADPRHYHLESSLSFETPESDIIYGAGFISPEGTPYSCEGMSHGQWILKYADWLDSEGYEVPGGMSPVGRSGDEMRDALVNQGWIHVFSPDMLSVKRLDHATQDRIRKAYVKGDVYLEEDRVKVWDRSSDDVITLTPNEESIFSSMDDQTKHRVKASLPDTLSIEFSTGNTTTFTKVGYPNGGGYFKSAKGSGIFGKDNNVGMLVMIEPVDRLVEHFDIHEVAEGSWGYRAYAYNEITGNLIDVYIRTRQEIFDDRESAEKEMIRDFETMRAELEKMLRQRMPYLFHGPDMDQPWHGFGASMIDYPRQSLASDIWEKGDGTYHILPEVKEALEKETYSMLSKYAKSPENWVTRLILGSSIASQFYTKATDIDVKAEIDANKFREANPEHKDLGDTEVAARLDSLAEEEDREMSYGSHPLEIRVRTEAQFKDPEFLKNFDSLYDLTNDVWLKEPKAVDPKKYSRKEAVGPGMKDAIKIASNWDLKFGVLRRALRELKLVNDYLESDGDDGENKAYRDKLVEKAVGVIERLYEEKKEVKAKRGEAYKKAKGDYEFINAEPDVVVMKLLVAWGYFSQVNELHHYLEDKGGALTAEDCDALIALLDGPETVQAGMVKASKASTWAAWISPEGKLIKVPYEHSNTAFEILTSNGVKMTPSERKKYTLDFKSGPWVDEREWAFNKLGDMGWIRVRLTDGRVELVIDSVKPLSSKNIIKILETLPQEVRFAERLNARGEIIDINPGEDALDAWKHRNDIRHRVQAEYTPRPGVMDDQTKFWISPENKFHSWSYTQKNKKHHDTFLKSLEPDKWRTTNDASITGKAILGGWIRGGVSSDGTLYLDMASEVPEADVLRAFSLIPTTISAKAKRVLVDDHGALYGETSVLEEETLEQAWKRRNDRHRVQADSQAIKFWVTPEGDFHSFFDKKLHYNFLREHLGLSENEVVEALDLGWTRGGLDVGTKGSPEYLYLETKQDPAKILSYLPEKVKSGVKLLTVDSGDDFVSVTVDAGEDVEKAWRMRNSIRKTVNAALQVKGESYWVTPEGEALPVVTDENQKSYEHIDALPEEIWELAESQEETSPLEIALSRGWARVIVTDDEVYIDMLNPESNVPKVLDALDKEKQLASQESLIVERIDVPTIPILEGETAQQAWKRRKDIRHRVKGSLGESKFWISDDGDFYELTPYEEHQVWIKSRAIDEGWPNQKDTSRNIFNKVLQDGWVRGGTAYPDHLYLQLLGGESEVEQALSAIPSEYLVAKTLAVQLGDPISKLTEVPILEGEDALDAWKRRKDIRHRVRAGFDYEESDSADLRAWISPEGEVRVVQGEFTHAEWAHAHDPAGIWKDLTSKEKQSIREEHHDEEQWLFEEYLFAGWVRVGLTSDGILYLQMEDTSDEKVLEALENLSHAGGRWLLCDTLGISGYADVPVLEGEDALDAWKHRNDIRHRVRASAGGGLAERLKEAITPVPGVRLDLEDYAPGIVEIALIEAKPKGKGNGTRVLKELMQKAKEMGIKLMLLPAGKRKSDERLVRYYERLGFYEDGGETMWFKAALDQTTKNLFEDYLNGEITSEEAFELAREFVVRNHPGLDVREAAAKLPTGAHNAIRKWLPAAMDADARHDQRVAEIETSDELKEDAMSRKQWEREAMEETEKVMNTFKPSKKFWQSYKGFSLVASVVWEDRYTALGLPYPDPETICQGQCEGLGVVPIYFADNLPYDPMRVGVSYTDHEINYWKHLWDKAEAEAHADDGWHFVKCPECGGSGKRAGESSGMSPEKEAIYEAVGEASMAWSETPKGVFDSAIAVDIAERLAEELGIEAASDAQLYKTAKQVVEEDPKWEGYNTDPAKAEELGKVQKALHEARSAEEIRQAWETYQPSMSFEQLEQLADQKDKEK